MTAGYSGTPLPKKLGFKEGTRARIAGGPPGFRGLLDDLPAGATLDARGADPLDLVLLFTRSAGDLREEFPNWMKKLATAGMLWVAWPKKTSGVATDLDENRVRGIGLAAGLVDVKVCAIDATWSGLKFVRRVKDR